MKKNDIPKTLYEDMKMVDKIRVVVEPWVDTNDKQAPLKVRLPGTKLVMTHNPSTTEKQMRDIEEGRSSRCYIYPTKGRTPGILKDIESANEKLHVTYEIDDEYIFLTIITTAI